MNKIVLINKKKFVPDQMLVVDIICYNTIDDIILFIDNKINIVSSNLTRVTKICLESITGKLFFGEFTNPLET